MGRRKNGNKIDGWINLNKPVGITSTQALAIVKRAISPMKAGHAGTLDPLASGVLPLALGEATKTVPYVQDAMKIYEFSVTWGEQRTTDDAEGDVISSSDIRPTREQIDAILPGFIGDINQTPPQFSAIKVDGERAYDLARDGEVVELKSRPVYIEELTILSHEDGVTAFECLCGKGTYVRSLARDMGLKLGCFGYISALKRTAVGAFTLEGAIPLDFFQNPDDKPSLEEVVLPLQTALDDIPALALKEEEAARLKQGQTLSFVSKPDLERLQKAGIEINQSPIVLALYQGKALALVEVCGPTLQPLRILNV
jgi:tRNA pseudouridine55 synthase